MAYDWDNDAEEVEVPEGGSFISFGNKKGQHVTGAVVDYQETGATNLKGNPCPLVVVLLTEKAASISKDGDRTDHDPGEIVNVSGGPTGLDRALKAANLKRGDLTKITLVELIPVNKGKFKKFGIKVARGKGMDLIKNVAAPDTGVEEVDEGGFDDDEPPF